MFWSLAQTTAFAIAHSPADMVSSVGLEMAEGWDPGRLPGRAGPWPDLFARPRPRRGVTPARVVLCRTTQVVLNVSHGLGNSAGMKCDSLAAIDRSIDVARPRPRTSAIDRSIDVARPRLCADIGNGADRPSDQSIDRSRARLRGDLGIGADRSIDQLIRRSIDPLRRNLASAPTVRAIKRSDD